MTIEKLQNYLYDTWSKETSSVTSWSHLNPSEGQCAVTALIVQDYFGGEIVNTKAHTDQGAISHYYNVINGKDVDLTRSQFKQGTFFEDTVVSKPGYDSLREYCLSFKDTHKRYLLLKHQIAVLNGM